MLYMMPIRIFTFEPFKETTFKASSDMSRHCCKCELNDGIGYVRSIAKDCRECQRMRFWLKNTIRLNLCEELYI